MGTHKHTAHTHFGERAHIRYTKRGHTRKVQLMPGKLSVQLMDGSYTAIMTYFDVACQSGTILDSGQKALESIL